MALVNELLEHYLIEARELVEAATEDLLALEETPHDAEAIDRVFRVFHTLKGSVGLFDLPAMLRVLHGAEDLLAAARAERIEVDAGLIDLALEILDQVTHWNDAVEATGVQPSSAEADADRLTSLFHAILQSEASPAQVEPAAIGADWLHDFLGAVGEVCWPSTVPLWAIRYVPRQDCFFAGDDPLGLVRRLDGILALRVTPVEPWGALDTFDGFACNLAIECLTSTVRTDVETVFRLVFDQVDVVAVTPTGGVQPHAEGVTRGGAPDATQTFAPFIRRLIEEQCLLLAASTAEPYSTVNVASASVTVRNVLRSIGAVAAAVMVDDAAAVGPKRLLDVITALLDRPETATVSDVRVPPAAGAPGPVVAGPRTIRVDIGRVDDVLGLVGELVVARNALAHLVANAMAGMDMAALVRSLRTEEAQLGRLVADLHRNVVGIRLLPFDQAFRRVGRPLREIAQRVGKKITFTTEGGDVEADKAVVDGLFEPLLHVVRNAVDHGVEDRSGRLRAGKREEGKVMVRARSEGENVVVSITDDGGGIDPKFIRLRARERGLADPKIIDAMVDEEVINLIFAPGFSTASNVTDISGRGVGMDAVRSAVTRLGGRVEVESEVGHGTTVSLIVPRTVALTQVMVVGAGDDCYGVPLDTVAEAVQVSRDRIVDLGHGEAVILRDRTVPVLRLARLLDPGFTDVPSTGSANLVMISSEDGMVAVSVDAFEGRIDAVVKPLGNVVPATPGITGTTLLGDGRVLLVLDLPALVGGASAL